MKTTLSLLPIAVALAACLWVTESMAQTVTVPAGAEDESRPAAHAGIATHDTGYRLGAGELPGTGERPGRAQPEADAILDSATALRQQALAAMETLREEIATLTALKHAQVALLAWNRGLTEANEGPATLAAALCAEPSLVAWCPLLPATFGTSHRGESHDRD